MAQHLDLKRAIWLAKNSNFYLNTFIFDYFLTAVHKTHLMLQPIFVNLKDNIEQVITEYC